MFDDLPKSRKEAKKLGVRKYFTGKPCPRGHNVPRYINGGCVTCVKDIFTSPEYRKKYYTREARYKHYVQSFFKIPFSTVEQIYKDQNGLCKICDKSIQLFAKSKSNNICIDHCHETGQVRGILCNSCNFGIGNFKDDILLLEKAINYLKAVNSTVKTEVA